jgi:hypothetical protein
VGDQVPDRRFVKLLMGKTAPRTHCQARTKSIIRGDTPKGPMHGFFGVDLQMPAWRDARERGIGIHPQLIRVP